MMTLTLRSRPRPDEYVDDEGQIDDNVTCTQDSSKREHSWNAQKSGRLFSLGTLNLFHLYPPATPDLAFPSGSGKSTLVGALMLATGAINERDLMKRRKDS